MGDGGEFVEPLRTHFGLIVPSFSCPGRLLHL
jgi:hypothetical protein